MTISPGIKKLVEELPSCRERIDNLETLLVSTAKALDAIQPSCMGDSMAINNVVEIIGLALGWEVEEAGIKRPY